MANLTFKTTFLAIQTLEKIIKARVDVHGLEHLEESPTLFVVNHFTRAETFIVPYIIHKYTGKFVHSLTDFKLFKGKFGEYLQKIGAVSIRETSRNRQIIGDLLTGRQNWVIYPEGVMVKTKKIVEEGKFFIRQPERTGPPHTGAAMVGLFSEIYKKYYLQALKQNDIKTIISYQKTFLFSQEDRISALPTIIIPVTITYYPIRPGKNILRNLVKKFFKKLPARLEEELEIEGNLLLSESDINIYFGEPIYTTDFLKRHFTFTKRLSPFLQKKGWSYFFFWRELLRLTQIFMKGIYGNVCLNIDHVFCTALYHCPRDTVSRDAFLGALHLSVLEIASSRHFRIHATLGDPFLSAVTDESYKPLENILALAVNFDTLAAKGDSWLINKTKLEKQGLFHTVRVENTLRVIANEIEPLKPVVRIIHRNIHAPEHMIRKKIVQMLCQREDDRFHDDYKRHFEAGVSHPRNIGKPLFLPGKSNMAGILIAHGYMAAPEEVRLLAEYLNNLGYSVYAPRLKGHGTSPKDLELSHWSDWYDSYNCGYAILKNFSPRVILAGFSAGGLLAFLAAARKNSGQIAGVISINAPIKFIEAKANLFR